MSFLSDTVFSGSSTRLHVAGNHHNGGKAIRKSKSHGGFLSPLSKLVRNPVQSIGDVVGSHYNDAPFQDAALDEDAGQRQILYLRMKNVCTRARCFGYHMLMASARPKRTTNGKLQRPTSMSWKATTHGRPKTTRQSTTRRWSQLVSASWMRPGSAAT